MSRARRNAGVVIFLGTGSLVFFQNMSLTQVSSLRPGVARSCLVSLPSCPHHEQTLLTPATFYDIVNGADRNQTECAKRASDWRDYCGTEQSISATSLDAYGTKLNTTVARGSHDIKLSACQVSVVDCASKKLSRQFSKGFIRGFYVERESPLKPWKSKLVDLSNDKHELLSCMSAAEDIRSLCRTEQPVMASAFDRSGRLLEVHVAHGDPNSNSGGEANSEGSGRAASCTIEAASCPQQGVWTPLLIANVVPADATMSVAECSQQLLEHRRLCGPGPQIAVTSRDSSGTVLSSVVSRGYENPKAKDSADRQAQGIDPKMAMAETLRPELQLTPDGFVSDEELAEFGTQNRKSLQAMIDLAVAGKKPVIISLPPGQINLTCPAAQGCLRIAGVHHLTIQGAGAGLSVFSLTNPRSGGFLVEDSSQIYFSDFSIDSQRLAAVPARVTSASSQRLHFNFESDFKKQVGSAYSPSDKAVIFAFEEESLKSLDLLAAREPLPSELDRVSKGEVAVDARKLGYLPGDRLVVARRDGSSAFEFNRVTDVGVRKVKIIASAGAALSFNRASGLLFVESLQVEPDLARHPGQIMTAVGGGIWSRLSKGKFVIENSVFTGLGDQVLSWPRGAVGAGSLFVHNTIGPSRGSVEVVSSDAVLQDNVFTDPLTAHKLAGQMATDRMPFLIGNRSGCLSQTQVGCRHATRLCGDESGLPCQDALNGSPLSEARPISQWTKPAAQ